MGSAFTSLVTASPHHTPILFRNSLDPGFSPGTVQLLQTYLPPRRPVSRVDTLWPSFSAPQLQLSLCLLFYVAPSKIRIFILNYFRQLGKKGTHTHILKMQSIQRNTQKKVNLPAADFRLQRQLCVLPDGSAYPSLSHRGSKPT